MDSWKVRGRGEGGIPQKSVDGDPFSRFVAYWILEASGKVERRPGETETTGKPKRFQTIRIHEIVMLKQESDEKKKKKKSSVRLTSPNVIVLKDVDVIEAIHQTSWAASEERCRAELEQEQFGGRISFALTGLALST